MATDKRSAGSPVEWDFGGRLRAAREDRGITLRQIAEMTKISAPALDALEHNDPSRLPGGIYSRAFVRTFASHVGLDPEQTLQEFQRRFPDHAPRTNSVAEIEGAMRRPAPHWGRIAGGLAVLAVAAAVGVVALIGWPARPAGPPETPGSSGASSATSTPAGEPARVTPASASLAAPGEVRTGTAGAATSPAASDPPAQETGTASFRLVIHPRAACWVRLTVDGRVALARLVGPGEREEFVAENAVLIEVGDAGAFDFTLDGEPGRPLGGAGRVVRALIDRESVGAFVAQPLSPES
jgi:cytoskeleton protein RodZ